MDHGSAGSPEGHDAPPAEGAVPPGYPPPVSEVAPSAPPPPGYGPPSGPPTTYATPPAPQNYGPPQWSPGGYGPTSGYGPPSGYGVGVARGFGVPGVPTPDERTWAMLSHLSYFVLGIIGPLVIMLTKGNESAFVREQAVEALNFHITMLIAVFASFILIFVLIGIFTMIASFVVGIVLTIMAAMASYRGERYRYPVALRLVH